MHRNASPVSHAPVRVLTVLLVADIAFAFQQTAIIPAIPTVQQQLHTSQAWAAWLLSAYLMVATVATPALGRYADLHGRKRVLLATLVSFLIGSVGAALSPNIAVLIIFRAVQGIGGAVFPLTFAVVRDEIRGERVSRAIGLLTGGFAVGTGLGFGVGGWLDQAISWRVIFAAGAVLVAVGTAAVVWGVPRSRTTQQGRLDVWGTLLLGTCTVGVLLALTLGTEVGWLRPGPIALLVAAVALGAAWVRVESRVAEPLVDLHVFRGRSVLLANAATVGLGWAMFGCFFLVPQLLRTRPDRAHYGFGVEATLTGIYLLPAALGQLVAGPLSDRLARRFTSGRVFSAGLVLAAVACALFATTHGDVWQVLLASLVLGAASGLVIQTSGDVVTQRVPPELTSVSTALNSTVRRFAGGIGAQVSATLLAGVATTAGGPSHASFTVAFVVAAALALVGAALALFVPAGVPSAHA